MSIEAIIGLVSLLGGLAQALLMLQLRTMRSEARQRSDGVEKQLLEFKKEFETRISRLEDRTDERLREVERDKLDVREWVRVSTSSREKMDQIITGLARLDARIDAEFGVASSIDRLAETLKGEERQ